MARKTLTGFAVVSVMVCIHVLSAVGVRSLLPFSAGWNTSAARRYEAKVAAVRAAYAAERSALDLGNSSGGLSTPESDLGEPPYMNRGGGGTGGASGASASADRSAQDGGCSSCAKGAPAGR